MVSPRDQIAKYSTQLVYTSETTPTFLSLLQGIDAELPNTVASTDKINWMNLAIREEWRWIASTKLFSTSLTAAKAIYTLPNDARHDKINYFAVSDSTARSSTENWTVYTPVGQDDELSGNQYYKAGGGVGIYSVPTTDDAGKGLMAMYEAIPITYASTTDTTSIPNISKDYINIVSWKVKRRVALAGASPDVEVANNCQAEVDEIVKKIKMNYYKKKAKNPSDKFSYKANWWNG